MQVLTSFKIEGGIPRDERRETIRALRCCPLERIIFIGVTSVLGNTWGANGRDLIEPLMTDEHDFLEGEDKEAIHALGLRPPVPAPESKYFQPHYGWQHQPPMMHTIVSHHSATLRELKFCGYKGAAVLYNTTPITQPMLAALKHCHRLETLIMSFWLSTLFEDALRDDEVISYWQNQRSASSTSLVSLSDDPPELGSWAHELKSKFAPNALAWRVVGLVGPYLSEEAKRRKGGVSVRASFCIGDWGGIFDIDVKVGKGSMASDICLGFEGPREEMEEGRRTEKLRSRRWF